MLKKALFILLTIAAISVTSYYIIKKQPSSQKLSKEQKETQKINKTRSTEKAEKKNFKPSKKLSETYKKNRKKRKRRKKKSKKQKIKKEISKSDKVFHDPVFDDLFDEDEEEEEYEEYEEEYEKVPKGSHFQYAQSFLFGMPKLFLGKQEQIPPENSAKGLKGEFMGALLLTEPQSGEEKGYKIDLKLNLTVKNRTYSGKIDFKVHMDGRVFAELKKEGPVSELKYLGKDKAPLVGPVYVYKLDLNNKRFSFALPVDDKRKFEGDYFEKINGKYKHRGVFEFHMSGVKWP